VPARHHQARQRGGGQRGAHRVALLLDVDLAVPLAPDLRESRARVRVTLEDRQARSGRRRPRLCRVPACVGEHAPWWASTCVRRGTCCRRRPGRPGACRRQARAGYATRRDRCPTTRRRSGGQPCGRRRMAASGERRAA
jgi:hypothetical protein